MCCNILDTLIKDSIQKKCCMAVKHYNTCIILGDFFYQPWADSLKKHTCTVGIKSYFTKQIQHSVPSEQASVVFVSQRTSTYSISICNGGHTVSTLSGLIHSSVVSQLRGNDRGIRFDVSASTWTCMSERYVRVVYIFSIPSVDDTL